MGFKQICIYIYNYMNKNIELFKISTYNLKRVNYINKFEKIRFCCNKCRYQAKTRNIEYFKEYYDNNKEIIKKQSKINYNKNKLTELSLIL